MSARGGRGDPSAAGRSRSTERSSSTAHGATDTNLVDYLGQPAANGGYEPITTCGRWQATLQAGRYQYLVLTPGPTAAVPLSWSRLDPSLTPILHPSADEWVFQIAPLGAPPPLLGPHSTRSTQASRAPHVSRPLRHVPKRRLRHVVVMNPAADPLESKLPLTS